jgi:hypothetical protein
MTRHTLVANEPPVVAFDPLNELFVSSLAELKLNFNVGAFLVDCTDIILNYFYTDSSHIVKLDKGLDFDAYGTG